MAALTGNTREEYAQRIRGDAAEIIYKEDRSRIAAAAIETLKRGQPIDETYRIYHKDGSLVWVRLNGVQIGEENGDPIIYAVFQRPARMEQLYDNLVNESKSIIYVSDISNYDLLYVNQAGLTVLGKSSVDYSCMKCYEFLVDRSSPCEFCQQSCMRTDAFLERDFTHPKNGKIYSMRGRLTDWNGILAHVEYLEDVTEIRRAERELLESKLRYEVAIQSSGLNLWEYDIQNDTVFLISSTSRTTLNRLHIEHYSRIMVQKGYIREDSVDCFLRIFERLRQGEREINEDIWYQVTGDSGEWCERVSYTSFLDHNGTPIKAFGAGRDVTREKEAEKKFYEEMFYRKAMQSENLATAVVDLTDDRVVEINSSFSSVTRLVDGTAELFFRQTAQSLTNEGHRRRYCELFGRKTLLNRFDSGEYAVAMEFTRLYDTNRIYWIHYSAHLIQNPTTKHVMAHVSCVDVTKEKVMQSIMETIVKADYDTLVVVDGTFDSALDYGVEGEKHLYDEHESFEKQIEKRICECVSGADRELLFSVCKIDYIWEQIKDGSTYKINFSMSMPDGEIRRKQLQFTAINSIRKTFLMSRIDVNSIYEEQLSAKNMLQDALLAAKQASSAKSDFLSRMSHEIRTPMNAIIGMSAIAAQSIGNDEQIADCISKIDISSRFLLSLINDILDMNRIESGKMLLKNDRILFEEFLNGVNSICHAQADAKSIVYENVVDSNVEDYYFGDAMKLQQVLINILYNAIKFTPEGGRISMEVRQIKKDKEHAIMQFVIRDTGCGISEEFLPSIFDPFTQEHLGTTALYGGTGLGLAICKNLVDMMDGHIAVRSTVDVGSEFTVDVKLGIIVKSQTRHPDKQPYSFAELSALTANDDITACEEIKEYRFEGKRILLVEDHPLNVEIARKLLESRGFAVEHAQNGLLAVELFATAPVGYYDAILMDIRMPKMDGLQAAAHIRNENKEDAKTIPILAMTANAFDEDIQKSKAVGMDAHLAKPINPKQLYQMLHDFICCGERQ